MCLLTFSLALPCPTASSQTAAPSPATAQPQEIKSPVTLGLLERRKSAQTAAARSRNAFHGFQFRDEIARSGIRFEHHMVEDAGKNYQAAHYDHGNGIAAADVDGDGLPDLLFLSQLGNNQLWRNLGGGRFEEITARAGIAMTSQISVAAAFADADNDGRPDLFITTVRKGNRFFKNMGGGTFEDRTQSAGLAHTGHSSGVTFLDFNNDGWLDLLVNNVGVYTSSETGPGGFYRALPDAFQGHQHPERTEYTLLYRNRGDGTFEEVAEKMGLRKPGWFGDTLVTDLNGDGFADVYLLNMQGDDRFFVNEGGLRMTEKTESFFPKTPWGATGGRFFDFNADGLTDLFVTDMHSDMTRRQTDEAVGLRPDIEKMKSEAYCSEQWTEAYLQGRTNNIFGNAFYRNLGQGRFTEESDQVGAETYWPWGVSSGDLNADGFEDLFVTAGMGYPFRYAINSVLINEGGRRFFDAEFLVGVEPRLNGRLGKYFFTLDCSGEDKTNKLCEGKSGMIGVPGSLSTRSSVILDLDADGDLDVVTNEFNDRPQLLISDLSARRALHFLKIQLVGSKSNRQGLGARVEVRWGGRFSVQYNDGKSGYLGQSDLPLYFGLPDSTGPVSVQVSWPSGRRQVVQSSALNRLLRIEEPR